MSNDLNNLFFPLVDFAGTTTTATVATARTRTTAAGAPTGAAAAERLGR